MHPVADYYHEAPLNAHSVAEYTRVPSEAHLLVYAVVGNDHTRKLSNLEV